MNLLQLIFKQMRQRALSTWLTFLSVTLGVALAIAILLLYRESDRLFAQTDYGVDVLVGPKGSPLQLTLNTIYHMDQSPGNIPYSIYLELMNSPQVRLAVPFAVGDTYKGLRLVGTTPQMFGLDMLGNPMPTRFEYRAGRSYELTDGRVFHPRKFEALVGSEVPQRTGLKIGDTFQSTHGNPGEGQNEDVHEEKWTVVGVLKPTGTANDRAIFVSLTSFYCVSEHMEGLEDQARLRAGEDIASVTAGPKQEEHPGHDEEGHDHHGHGYTLNPDGTINLDLTPDELLLSAVLVRATGDHPAGQLLYLFQNRTDATAVSPAIVMRDFFKTFLKSTQYLLLAISGLVTVVAAVGILVSIYNSVSARLKEIAIIRALGATRLRVLALICLEAGAISLMGALAGLVLGHALGAVGNLFFRRYMGEGINYLATDVWEWAYLGLVVLIGILAGLVPALKAYKTPVATNLVG